MTEAELHYELLPDGTAVITGGAGGRKRLIIPSEIGGFPVSGIASHAFADRNGLREVTLPGSVRSIGSYAFYHCGDLERLFLADSIEDYADGVIRMCPSLSLIEIRMDRGRWRLVKELTADSDAELNLRLVMPDGTAELLFPGYYNEFREDTRARAIHQSIVGAGYAYRQCLTRAGVDFPQYDACFQRIAGVDMLSGGRIALGRLFCPYRLREQAEKMYTEYLGNAAGELLPYLIEEEDAERIRFLVRKAEVPRAVLEDGIGRASDARLAEICSILMEAARREGGGGLQMMSLDDLGDF